MIAELDFETYSEAGYYFDPVKQRWRAPDGFPAGKAGLQSVGTPAYAEHPSTEVLCMAYDLKDGLGPRLWVPGDAPPVDLFSYIAAGGLVEAYNSFFEYYIWVYVCTPRMGWPALPLAQLRCAMGKAAAWGLPGKLAKAAEVINAPEQKDKAGDALIKNLCCPRNPTKKDLSLRRTPASDPEDFKALGAYCVQDIKAEAAVSHMTPDLLPEELKLWLLDQRINTRGVYIDPKGLADCISIVKQAKDQYTAELTALVGIPDITVDKHAQLRDWAECRGFTTPSIDKDHVAAALKRTDLPPDVYRMLELRATLGSASVKKTAAIERTVSADGRLRNLFVFHGARQTGRFAGMGAQPQNLTAGGPDACKCDGCGAIRWGKLPMCPRCYSTASHPVDWGIGAVEVALEAIATRSLPVVESLWGDATAVVAGCLRGLFSAAPGHDLICSDYSAIEAVVLAELAGETWRQEVFRTHGKIYEMSAAKISGLTFEQIMEPTGYDMSGPNWWLEPMPGKHHPLRKMGKVAELASGYQGSEGAWLQFDADKYMDRSEILPNVKTWRRDSRRIVKFWYGLEDAARSAIQDPGRAYGYRGIRYKVTGDVLYCCLLSGRTLTYHRPRLHPDVTPWGKEVYKITFEGWNSDSTKGPVGWMRRDTYGGKLCENVVQATARDILAYAMLNLDKAGYPVVLHVHDEIVSEVKAGVGSVAQFETIMAALPPWCADWPIKAAGGWRGKRYRKD